MLADRERLGQRGGARASSPSGTGISIASCSTISSPKPPGNVGENPMTSKPAGPIA